MIRNVHLWLPGFPVGMFKNFVDYDVALPIEVINLWEVFFHQFHLFPVVSNAVVVLVLDGIWNPK